MGSQVVDDAYLARVLELMLGVTDNRLDARRLEVSGLGYVNLLHIAVTLAAILDLDRAKQATDGGQPDRPAVVAVRRPAPLLDRRARGT